MMRFRPIFTHAQHQTALLLNFVLAQSRRKSRFDRANGAGNPHIDLFAQLGPQIGPQKMPKRLSLLKQFQWGNHPVRLETGEIARQAGGAALVDVDETLALATVVGAKSARPSQD